MFDFGLAKLIERRSTLQGFVEKNESAGMNSFEDD